MLRNGPGNRATRVADIAVVHAYLLQAAREQDSVTLNRLSDTGAPRLSFPICSLSTGQLKQMGSDPPTEGHILLSARLQHGITRVRLCVAVEMIDVALFKQR